MKHSQMAMRIRSFIIVFVPVLFISWQIAQTGITVKFLGDYPRNRETGWSDDAQGLANDNANWYVSQKGKLWRIPVKHNLNDKISSQTPGIITTSIPKSLKDMGFNHFGDPDCFDGKLIVPLERDDKSKPQRIAIFRASDLAFLSSAELVTTLPGSGKQTNASWCAIDPSTKILWISNYENVDRIFGYKWDIDNKSEQLILTHISTKKLDHIAKKVQGGAFSPHSGLFYLVSHTSSTGLLAWDWKKNKYLGNTKINYSPDFPNYQELEGITIWNLDSQIAPGIRGQVHVVLIENDATTDDEIWIKHFDVNLEK